MVFITNHNNKVLNFSVQIRCKFLIEKRQIIGFQISASLIVPRTGLEPARLAARAPETRASTIPPPGQRKERKTRLELATPTLARLCSTNWAISAWYDVWRGGDSNSHASRHYHLKVARLPIPPPLQHVLSFSINLLPCGSLNSISSWIAVQRYGFFWNWQNILVFFCLFAVILFVWKAINITMYLISLIGRCRWPQHTWPPYMSTEAGRRPALSSCRIYNTPVSSLIFPQYFHKQV